MKYFETHHVTIDLNELDPQSTLSTTDCKSSTNQSNNYGKRLYETKQSESKKRAKEQSDKLQLSDIIASLKDKKQKQSIVKYESPIKDLINSSAKDDNTSQKQNKVWAPKKREEGKLKVELNDSNSMLERNHSKESDMCNPMSIDEDELNKSSSVDHEELMANINAYNNRLNKCLNLAAASENQNYSNKNKNVNSFEIDDCIPYLISNEYYLKKRRGGLERPNNNFNVSQSHNGDLFRNINSIVHIRQNIDCNTKITPSSSLKSIEYLKMNRLDSSSSEDKSFTERTSTNRDIDANFAENSSNPYKFQSQGIHSMMKQPQLPKLKEVVPTKHLDNMDILK